MNSRPQLRDYDYLERSFGRACYLADLRVWREKLAKNGVVPEVVPEEEEDEFAHLQETFRQQSAAHPDLLEPYVTLLGQVDTQDEQQQIMWRGLRETFKRRFPLDAARSPDAA